MSCFLCDWIRADLKRHGKLTDWSPADAAPDAKTFPKAGKILHLKLEFGGKRVDNDTKLVILNVE